MDIYVYRPPSWFPEYSICPCCGYYHDSLEGGAVIDNEKDKQYFVCIDCIDNYEDVEILRRINEKSN